jgi:hypothetical protein
MAFENALVGTDLEGQGSDLFSQVVGAQGTDPEALSGWLSNI